MRAYKMRLKRAATRKRWLPMSVHYVGNVADLMRSNVGTRNDNNCSRGMMRRAC